MGRGLAARWARKTTEAFIARANDHYRIAEQLQFEKELPRTPLAPRSARRALTNWYAGTLEHQELHRAKLLASELVTNAVVHGEGRILLRARANDDRVLVEVIDEGAGFEHDLRRTSFMDLHGRGLEIVDAESSRWGIHEGATHVWFELELAGPRLGPESKPAL